MRVCSFLSGRLKTVDAERGFLNGADEDPSITMSSELASPDCPKCRLPMRLVYIGANRPQFRCSDCSGDDPLRGMLLRTICLLGGEQNPNL